MQVLSDRVLVKPAPAEEKTASGIIIPDTAKEKPSKGKVIATGNEAKFVKTSDTVLYGKYAGMEIEINNEKLLIIREADIFVIL